MNLITMKYLAIGSALILGLTFGCQEASQSDVSLTVSNPTALEQTSAQVVIPVAELESKGMTADAQWAPHVAGEIVPFQYDDLDLDGKPDELVFALDLPANGTETVTFTAAENVPEFAPRTHIRLGKKSESGISPITEATRLITHVHEETEANFQFEGVGWENEEVAFRNYMDLRNGMDIFGKTEAKLYLDNVGLDGDESYHELSDWGMGILKVGSSLGAGSVAFWYQDSLIRLTSDDADFRVISEGPVRSTFELNFRAVDLGDKKIDVTHTVSISAGTWYYEADLELSDSEGIVVVPGLVNLHEMEDHTLESESAETLFTFGEQSENADMLGMALMVSANNLGTIMTDSISEEIPNTYAFLLELASSNYRFYAAWELSDDHFKRLFRFWCFETKRRIFGV